VIFHADGYVFICFGGSTKASQTLASGASQTGAKVQKLREGTEDLGGDAETIEVLRYSI
jgi:hypothetical protein